MLNKRYEPGILGGFVTGSTGGRPFFPFDDRPTRGYQIQRARHRGQQNVERRFFAFKLAHPQHDLASEDPRIIGELSLLHKLGDMGYRDYRGRRLEDILGLAVSFNWQASWGPDGAPQGLDPEAILQARETVELMRANIDAHDQEKANLEAEQRALIRRAGTLSGDTLAHALVEVQTLEGRMRRAGDRRVELERALAQAEAERDRAGTTTVPLLDEIDPAEYERRLAHALGEASPASTASLPLADSLLDVELLTIDVAELLGVHVRTITRWRQNIGLPRPAPFDPNAWCRRNAKDWRLRGRDIALDAIPAPDPLAALLDRCRFRLEAGYRRREAASAATAIVAPDTTTVVDINDARTRLRGLELPTEDDSCPND